MNVLVVDALFDQPEAFDALDEIVVWVELGRHEWVSRSVSVFESSWLAEPGRTTRRNTDMMKKIYRATTAPARRDRLTVIVQPVDSTPNALCPSRARDCLDAPLFIIVENEASDGAFLRAIAGAYGKTSILDAMERGFCVLDHAGGKGEVKKRVAACRSKPMPRTGKRLGDVARIFVLVDSDRLDPDKDPEELTEWIDDTAAENVGLHVLYKRDSENYLPVDVLPSDKKRSRVRQAFLRLPPRLRDVYDMKIGFKVEADRPVVPPEQQQHFSPSRLARPADLNELCGGFGKSVGKRYGDDKWKRHLTEEAFEAVCETKPNELRDLLEAIDALL
jgi:hypothetical protein